MAERMGKRAKSCPTPMLVVKIGDLNLFHVYKVDLLEW